MNFNIYKGMITCLICVNLVNCSTTETGNHDISAIVANLPDNSCYEESPLEFKSRISKAAVFVDSSEQTEYMHILGDGTFSQRLFIYNGKNHELKLIQGAGNKTYNNVSIYDFNGGYFK